MFEAGVAVLGIFILVIYFFGARGRLSNVANPAAMYLIFFALPLALNRLRLSELQAVNWSSETYILIFNSLLTFGLFPIIYMTVRGDSGEFSFKERLVRLNVAVVLVVVNLVLQLILNFTLSGYFVPAAALGNITARFHTTEEGGALATFATAIWYISFFFVAVRALSAKCQRSWIMLALLAAMPLSRLARFDLISAIFSCVVYYLCRWKLAPRAFLLMGFSFALIATAGAFLAKFRWSGGDVDAVSFSDLIEYTGPQGPFEVFAFLYTYYPLSFENIDRIVNPAIGPWDKTYGAILSLPLVVGILKMNYMFPEWPMMSSFDAIRDPLSSLATVPTALPAFAMDFGVELSFVPMMMYSAVGVWLYSTRGRNRYILYSFCLYSINYLHFPFQNNFMQPLMGTIMFVGLVMTRFLPSE